MSEEPIYQSPVLRTVDEHGHVEVTWPDPPRPFYEVAHEVVAEVVQWRNEYADMITQRRARDERIIRAAYAYNYENGRHSYPHGHEVDAIIAAAEADQ